MGTMQAVVETWRNITATGADPLAITDNMNFGNPERPEIMGQFVGSVEGMKEACLALKYPVVSGNVSLYNETNGIGIPPTPAIGGVGLILNWTQTADIALKSDGDLLIVIGKEAGHLGQSLYQQSVTGKTEGAPPPVDLGDEIKAGNLVRALIRESKVLAVHDVSDGGLIVAIAEMALKGERGVQLYPYEGRLPAHAAWFGEDQGRYVLEATPAGAEEILDRARLLGLPARVIGKVGGQDLSLKGEAALPLDELRRAHEGWLPDYMDKARVT
jgi:phosphoribosylformylglycinamidine synthase